MTEHTLSRKPTLAPAAVPKPKTLSSLVHHATASGGGSLDTKTQREMGSRFGHDFSQVRIHTDTQAAASVHAMDANAYAVGSDIVFGPGRYAPGSPDGDRLLAHELTHVVQQSVYGAGHRDVSSERSDASEQEAERIAAQVLQGQTVQVGCAPNAMIARDPDYDGPSIGPYIPPDQTTSTTDTPEPESAPTPTGDALKSFTSDLVGMVPVLGNLFNANQIGSDIDRSDAPGVGDKARSMGQTDTLLDAAGAIPVVGNVLSAGRAGFDLGSAGLRLAGANPNYAPTSGEAFNDLMGLF